MRLGLQEAIVTIQYVSESRTKGTWSQPDGRRRFVIGAEKTTGDSKGERTLGLTTLDPWKASLCIQARDKKFPLAIKFRETRYFDADLLWAGLVKEEREERGPDADPELDHAAQAALEHWQRGPRE